MEEERFIYIAERERVDGEKEIHLYCRGREGKRWSERER